jgi:heat-inducible transcriptional repressor
MSVTPNDRHRLTAREREVLDAVVTQYIQTGVPVGSRIVAKSNSEELSAATIRSIMADLEEAGFVTHPHTSAGRVPTDLGYRYYVDALQGAPRLSTDERARIASSLYAAGGLDSLLQRCCNLLSAASNQIAVATIPDVCSTMFRHVELIKLNDERLLVVFLSAAGLVHQRVVEVRVPESQAELERAARYLNSELAGRTLAEVRDHLAQLMEQERTAYDALARRAVQLGAQYFVRDLRDASDLVVDGTERFLERPDLDDFDRMKSLIAALEEKSRILRVLSSVLDHEGVKTAIGSENQAPELVGCSLVATSYGYDDARVGTLGIIGPTRMEYDRAMALVEYVAELLGSALAVSKPAAAPRDRHSRGPA